MRTSPPSPVVRLAASIRRRALAAAWLGLVLAAGAAAQTDATPPPSRAASDHRQTYPIAPAGGPIKIDGAIDEAAWQNATVIPLRYEYLPGDNTEPPVQTEGLVTYDHDNLYVAWRAHDPDPRKIRAHLMDRDSINTFVQDDHVVMLLDTFDDERRAYQFRVNPLGVQADAINSDVDGSEDWSFDLIWASAGRITSDGYEVEIAIPWKQVRFPSGGAPLTMSLQLERSWPRAVRHRVSSSWRDRGSQCLICQFDKVAGFTGLQPGRNVELDPTLTAHRTDVAPAPGDDLASGDTKAEAGLTARWGVTPNVSVGAAWNPDFSQVEADAQQLDVNERFALFFPEKRPFFLEGADFFNTPIQAVFTRTVVDPQAGVKVTGKVGPNAGGLFVTEDHVNSFLVPSNQGTAFALLDENVRGSVVRYRRDVLQRSTIGVLYAGREGEGSTYHNRVAGVDGSFQLGAADNLRVQYLRSDTQYPQGLALDLAQPLASFGGNGWMVNYNHGTRDWSGTVLLQDLGERFRADSGFVPRVDVRTIDSTLTRFWFANSGWWNQIQLGGEVLRTENHHSDLTDQGIYLFGSVAAVAQSNLALTLAKEKTLFAGVLYDDLRWARVVLTAQPTGAVKLDLTARKGDAVDFFNNRPADELRLTPAVELKLGRHLNTQLSHDYQRLEVLGGEELFTARLTQLRAVYNFNVRTFVRAIVQYEDVSRNPAVYTFPVGADDKTLFTQLLFSYKLNPQTVLFAGYSDDAIGFQQGIERLDLTRTDRTFFVKIGYAFLF